MKYKIDKDIPVPSRRKGVNLKDYPFELLQIGDSFFIENKTLTESRIRYLMQKATYQYKHLYILRPVKGGFRIWRQQY